MTTYCTVQDVKLALAPVSDWGDDNGATAVSLPANQIADAIDEAEGIINTYLTKRYTITPVEDVDQIVLPLADPPVTEQVTVAPGALRGWTRDIAAYLATLTFRKGKDLGGDDPIRLRFNMVMGFLTGVRDHQMDLPLPGVDDESAVGDLVVVNMYEGQLFDMTDVGLGYAGRDVQRFEPYRNQWS